jgi:hypothetical protein
MERRLSAFGVYLFDQLANPPGAILSGPFAG